MALKGGGGKVTEVHKSDPDRLSGRIPIFGRSRTTLKWQVCVRMSHSIGELNDVLVNFLGERKCFCLSGVLTDECMTSTVAVW